MSLTGVFFGDSITAISPVSLPTGSSYPDTFKVLRARTEIINRGIGGSMVNEFPFFHLGTPPSSTREMYHMGGTNDWFLHGDGPNEMALFDLSMRAQLAFMAGANKFANVSTDWSFVGSSVWVPSTYYNNNFQGNVSLGRVTARHGDVAEINFDGDWFMLVYTIKDGSPNKLALSVAPSPGQGFNAVAELPVMPPRAIGDVGRWTLSGADRSVLPSIPGTLAAFIGRGFGAGTHRLRCVSLLTDAQTGVQIDWLTTGPNGVPSHVLGSPLADATVPPLEHAAQVLTYNSHKSAIVAEFRALGFTNVDYSNPTFGLVPASDTIDGSHPNGRGTLFIAAGLPFTP